MASRKDELGMARYRATRAAQRVARLECELADAMADARRLEAHRDRLAAVELSRDLQDVYEDYTSPFTD